MASFSGNSPRETLSKINLVDLAGSERATSTKAEGQRLIEGETDHYMLMV
jgi:kinesin family protein 16B